MVTGNTEAASREVVLDPRGTVETEEWSLAARLDSLADATVGLLDTRKTNADRFLETVGEGLRSDYDVETTVYRTKSNGAAPAGDVLGPLVERCDAVVNAYGDCGSCTSWCVHDSVTLEKRGIPTATVNSEEFVRLGQSESRALGLDGLPIVAVEHPLGDADVDQVEERATGALPELVEALTGDRAELADAYEGRYLDADEDLGDEGYHCPIR